jgi:hypothetical protein
VANGPEHTRSLDELIRDGLELLSGGEELHACGSRVNDWAEQTITAAREQGREDIAQMTQAVVDHLADTHAVHDAASQNQHEFESGSASADLVAQAERLIMERFNVDSVRASRVLSELAQNTGIPVRVVAERVAERVANRKICGSR